MGKIIDKIKQGYKKFVTSFPLVDICLKHTFQLACVAVLLLGMACFLSYISKLMPQPSNQVTSPPRSDQKLFVVSYLVDTIVLVALGILVLIEIGKIILGKAIEAIKYLWDLANKKE